MQKQTLSLFWRFSKPYALLRNTSIIAMALSVIAESIAAPYVLSIFLNRLQAGDITFQNSLPLILVYAGLVFAGGVVLVRVSFYSAWTFQDKSKRQIYLTIFEKLSRESLSFHANRFGGSLVSQTSKMNGAFDKFWDTIIWNIVPMTTSLIGAIIVLIMVGPWQYALFIIGYSIVFMLATAIGSRFLLNRNRNEATASNYISGFIADMVTNVATVKAFGAENSEYRGADKASSDWYNTSAKLKWGVLWSTSAISTIATVGLVAVLIYATIGAEQKLLSIGVIYLMLTYALSINNQLWGMGRVSRDYYRVVGDAYEMTKILHTDYDLIDNSKTSLDVTSGEVVFNNVSFTHDNGEGENVFNNFSLVIPAGQRVGIVGRSGSGKTTLTKILLRFADIDHGEILIDNQDISQVTQKSLHQSIAFVSQEPMLFHRSLQENISYGKQDASKDEILAASEKANALEFIKQLPKGLDTIVGERGIKLSGGQRQRVAIARAILTDAPILVLDEATSALDSESEKLIQASLDSLMRGRTSIVIAHRLSTISKLDRIIVLDKGKIIEDGTHESLIKQNGTYAKLWSHQSGGFIEG